MAGRPYILAETTWQTVRDTDYQLAVLPWGATEAHNLHLPYGTDVIQSEDVAAESARQAWEQGARVVVLPTVPFGVNTGQIDIKLCLNMNPSTQLALLDDIVSALSGQGLTKLVIVNGHGANDFRQMLRELIPRHPGVFMCTVNWWQVVAAASYFDEAGDHAGEMETSILLDIAPRLVLPLSQAGSGRESPSTLQALNEGWVWTQRPWTRISGDTGVGNPAASDARKGRRFLDAVTAKLAGFLVDLAQTDADEIYRRRDGQEGGSSERAEQDAGEGHDR